MNLLIISGFLGSGKTSFILQLAEHMLGGEATEKVVILENEIGEVSVDDKILQGAGYSVRTLFSGCICCSISGSLPLSISTIQKDINPDWIIIEASGIAYPGNINQNIKESLGIDSRICCIVDTVRWERLLRPMANLLSGQLSDANIILVNKSDSVDSSVLESTIESVRGFNNRASIIAVSTKNGIDTTVFDAVTGKEE